MGSLLVLVAIGVLYGGYKLLEAIVNGLSKSVESTKAHFKIDKTKNILERNQDIITKYWTYISADNQRYSTEHKIKDAIRAIAEREGRPSLGPSFRERLWSWERRPDIPKDYLWLKQQLEIAFDLRLNHVVKEKEQRAAEEEARRQEQIDNTSDEIYQRNSEVVQKFVEIAERKVSIIDEYGDENWDVFEMEVESCMRKIMQRDRVSVDWREPETNYHDRVTPYAYARLASRLRIEFRNYHAAQKLTPRDVNVDTLAGIDFETYIAGRLRECGYHDVCGTSATGDQGADLIAKKNGRTIIIQAKRYHGTVGNKAVQEVVSAVSFYGGDEGWVITNSTFTPSARALAQKTKVRLFEGRDMERLAEILRE